MPFDTSRTLTASEMTTLLPYTFQAPTAESSTHTLHPLASLPGELNMLDPSHKLTQVVQTCLTALRETPSNGAYLNTLTLIVQQNFAVYTRNSSEIQDLKNLLAYAQPSPEIIVTGIPATTTSSHQDIIRRILQRLSLAGLQQDI